MGDKRTDPGQYYPGGKVVSQHGVAPPQIIVQWSDVQGKPQIAPLPDRYRDSDVKEKVNEIASKFATALAVALVGWTAFAGLVVQKAPKEDVWNDEEIVTNAYLTGENASGSVRTLPKYLWIADLDDSYPEDAAWYYRQPQDYGHCSSVRDGNTYSRNLDWKFNSMAEVIIRMSAGQGRFASLGVANVGTNLTEEIVARGAPTRYVKALPGHTVDGINENGVVCNVNVVDGPISGWNGGDIHPLGAVRWVLDHATSALDAATNLAARIGFPQGWSQNFHWMVADADTTYIVENGEYRQMTGRAVMTNFPLIDRVDGTGLERYNLLMSPTANITNAWWTLAYLEETSTRRYSDLETTDESVVRQIFDAWALGGRESHRGQTFGNKTWWQTVHTTVYDIENRVMRISVQEKDDWYTVRLPAQGGKSVEIDPTLSEEGKAADAYATGQAIQNAGKVKKVANVGPDSTGNVPLTASSVGAFPAASGQTLQQAVQVISVHLNAEDAKDVITNYDSTVNMPSRRLEYKIPDGPDAGTWRVVWDELTRWNWLTGTYLPANFYTKAEVDARTDHIQWGLFDSQTGNFSPEKTVQISSDRVILCKGASYQRTATAQGSYWVWTSNEPYSITGVESNGYFRIEDAEGNTTFEIVKGDKVTAAATAGGVSTEQVMGITHLHISYPIETDTHPTLEICNDLKTHDWKAETDGSCLANVTWTGVSGNYSAEVWGKGVEDPLFVKATYQRGSDPYVRYAQAIALQTVKIGNTIYYVGTATISGHTVLTLSLTPPAQ